MIREIIIFMGFLLAGCGQSTRDWMYEKLDPDGMIIVSKEEASDIIGSLKKGDFVQLSNGSYLIPKSQVRKFGDYTIIYASVPVTVTIDTVLYVVDGIAKVLATPGQDGASPITIAIPIK